MQPTFRERISFKKKKLTCLRPEAIPTLEIHTHNLSVTLNSIEIVMPIPRDEEQIEPKQQTEMAKTYQKQHQFHFIINTVLIGIILTAIIAFTHIAYSFIWNTYSNQPFVTRRIDPPFQKPEIDQDYDLTSHYYNYSSDEYLIDTQGCRIQKYAPIPKEYTKKYCDGRVVFIEKVNENQIQFLIHDEHSKYKLDRCIYQYVIMSNTSGSGYEDVLVMNYSNPKYFINGTIANIEQEIINITCQYLKNGKAKSIIYQDIYMIVKKKKENSIQNMTNDVVNKWNVLLLGLDTMSRARVYRTMPKTTSFLKQLGWLDYNAYHKIASNTYPNIIALLTGKNSVFNNETRKRMIWNTFQKHGYVTAHGEDEMSDTFKTRGGFGLQPTDHFMRPLFVFGEIKQSHTFCTGTLFSSEQILNYAFDFAQTYQKSNPFFGFFWITYTHNIENDPSQIDILVKKLFKKLNYSGILKNTFTVLLSDHGFRFGSQRFLVQSYYDNRLPMLFIRVPELFRKLYPKQYSNAVINQKRLVTSYDHHATLLDILNFAKSSSHLSSSICRPYCLSIFNDHPVTRTCADANISDKWCACHTLKLENFNDSVVIMSINTMSEFVKQHITSISTIKCTKCEPVELKSVLRVHSYETDQKKYFVVAISVTVTNNYYEGVVVYNGNNYEVIGGIEVISQLFVFDNNYCALDMYLRGECVCSIEENCKEEEV